MPRLCNTSSPTNVYNSSKPPILQLFTMLRSVRNYNYLSLYKLSDSANSLILQLFTILQIFWS